MRPRGGAPGQAVAEYLAVIGVVVALFLVLTATRAHRPGRLPVNPITRVGVLVVPPPPPPVVRVRPPAHRPRGTRPRRPRPTVRAPRWALGR
ncbi:MAG: hypothetical protein KDC33_12900 [Thermoleophilia bacterium]|nr:hypothetical protein [Thermoleophilia bacterium]